MDPQSTSSFCGPNGFYSFSSTASSVQCSTPNSLSEGKRSRTTEKLLAVTLMYSYKNGNNVLFLEVGKDFVDILLRFLTLPMGGIVKLLYGGSDLTGPGPGPDEAIFKLFNSVEKMANEKFCTSKKSLLDPLDVSGFGNGLLQPDPEQEPRPGPSASSDCSDVYYSCGMVPHCVCITKRLGRRCPLHGRKMQTLCKILEGTSTTSVAADNGKPAETGYVKDVGKFFITDNLAVYPDSKSLELLQKLRVERMSSLTSVDLFIGMDEILELLKASLVSTNVLQDVFGRLLRERILQDDEPIPYRQKKLNSDSMPRVNKTIHGCPTQQQGATPKYNCMKRDDKIWSDRQYRPGSTPNLQRPQPLSMPSISNKSNCRAVYGIPSNAQRSLVRPISLPNKTKQSYSYKEIHYGNGDKKYK